MEAYISFLIRASVYLILFGAGYMLFFRSGKPFFNRLFILMSFVLSIGLASFSNINVNFLSSNAAGETAILLPEIIIKASGDIPQLTQKASNIILGFQVWHFVFMGFIAFLFFQFCVRLWKIYHLIKNNIKEPFENIKLVLLNSEQSPFSFFHWVFIPSKLKNNLHFNKVIRHEKAHYYYRHSWDIIFLELMRFIFWFHPFMYFFRYEIQNLHEFEADQYTLKNCSKTDYQKALLDFAVSGNFISITNPFNFSTIKKRFIMMNKTKNQSLNKSILKLFVFSPFIVTVFFIQSCDFQTEKEDLALITTEQGYAEGELTEEKTGDVPENPIIEIVDGEVVFKVLGDAQIPEFVGGQLELHKYLQENLVYPEKARKEGVEGSVFVEFIVRSDGSISDVSILRGISPELDQSAVEVVRAMPSWKPGHLGAEPINARFTMPIRFVLN